MTACNGAQNHHAGNSMSIDSLFVNAYDENWADKINFDLAAQILATTGRGVVCCAPPRHSGG
jgi:hypothetical protein